MTMSHSFFNYSRLKTSSLKDEPVSDRVLKKKENAFNSFHNFSISHSAWTATQCALQSTFLVAWLTKLWVGTATATAAAQITVTGLIWRSITFTIQSPTAREVWTEIRLPVQGRRIRAKKLGRWSMIYCVVLSFVDSIGLRRQSSSSWEMEAVRKFLRKIATARDFRFARSTEIKEERI